MLIDSTQQLQFLGHIVARLQFVERRQIQQHTLAQPVDVAHLDGLLEEGDGVFQVARVQRAHAEVVEELEENKWKLMEIKIIKSSWSITIEFEGSIFSALLKHEWAVLKSFWATAIRPLSMMSRISEDDDLEI